MSNQNLAKQLNILLQKNLFKDSLELLELNLKQNPLLNKDPDFLNIYGLIQLNLKDWEQAIKYFMKATEIDTNFRPAYFNLGLAYYDLGKLNNAYESFCKVLEIDKNNKRAQENIIKIAEQEILNSDPEISDEDLDLALSMTQKMLQPQWMSTLSVLGGTFMGFFYSLIISFFVKKDDPNFIV